MAIKTRKTITQIVAGACAIAASAVALAAPIPTSAVLPGINELTATLYGQFHVYSADLLAQCAATRTNPDPRCSPSSWDDSQYKLQSGPGQISAGILIYQGGASGSNYDNASGPFDPNAPSGDNPFVPPSGTTLTYAFNATDEPAPPDPGPGQPLAAFTGDQVGTWEVQLGTLAAFLGWTDADPANDNNLVFLFDNNQEGGAGLEQWLYVWASAAVLNSAGAVQNGQCYELFANSAPATDCHLGTGLVDPVFSGGFITNPFDTSYVAVVGDFCIDKQTGVAFTPGTITKDDCENAGDYWITNNLGQSLGEFAAVNFDLENYIRSNFLAHPDWVLSVNAKFANLNDGNEQLWIGGTVVNQQQVPEPASLALLGLGFASIWGMSRRRRDKS